MKPATHPAALALMGAAWLYWRTATHVTQAAGEASQGTPYAALWSAEEALTMPLQPNVDGDLAERNTSAFLRMIRHAEGTADADGYRALFGHSTAHPRLFSGFNDHPRIASQFTDRAGRRLWTTAAGAYQLMAVCRLPGGSFTRVNTWDRLQARLELPDFSPQSQDRAALELIAEQGALSDVRAGRLQAAVERVRSVWASLPGAGYDQAERPFAELVAAYQTAGGTLA